MSNDSPPIEQQRFARSQTPESPRPVHLPEPAKIPVLLNQMDESSNDLATYNIPTDQTFAHYGDSLENPAYKTLPNQEEAADPFRDFLRQADSAVAIHLQPDTNPIVPENPTTSASAQYTNQSGLPLSNGQVASNANIYLAAQQQADSFQPTLTSNQTQSIEVSQGTQNLEAAQSNSKLLANIAEDGNQIIASPATATVGADGIKTDAGVDYQSLLDNITQSASTAPAAGTVIAPTTDPVLPDAHATSLPSFPGLPKKPPPLETQLPFSTSQYAQAQNQSASANTGQEGAANGYSAITNQYNSSNLGQSASANPFDGGMTNEQAIAMHMQYTQQNEQANPPTPPDRAATEPSDRPWSPKTQAEYDSFLEDERHYVTEGIWDRFPLGSRLFVGNLPSEKVTKRDLFHRFHRFGKLAQISIKQAYGFIQYHDSESCKKALDAEQGVELRGRKVHLEISKPQKGSKSAQQQTGKNQNQNQNQTQNRRRSRSPQRRTYSDYRDEPSRRREEYRRRSPSPRGYRRDDRTRDERRSPLQSNLSTPRPVPYDEEANLPYPRRDPRYVPDVQVIVLDGVNQAFVNWVEDGLKRKGLSAASTWLNQRTPLAAVVKRQIMEGVQAVVKVSSAHQNRSKIPLQVFDRSAGTSNVTFNEYVDLDIPVAADIVLSARQRERGMQAPRPPFPPALIPPQSPYQQSPNTPWSSTPQVPQYPPQHIPPPVQHYQYPAQPLQPPQGFPQPPVPQNQIYRSYPTPGSATSQPPNLHDLLANLKGGSAPPPTPQSAHSVSQPYTPYAQPPPPPPQFYGQPAYQYPNLPPPPQQNQNGAGQQNVQNIMDQLARYQRQ